MNAILEAIGKIAVALLEGYLARSSFTEDQKKDYIQFIEIMNRRGLTTVQARLDESGQIERAKKLWDGH